MSAQPPIPQDFNFLPIAGDHRILVIRVQYPDLGPTDVFPFEEALAYAAGLKETMEINSFGKAEVTIDFTSLLVMPKNSTEYTGVSGLVGLRTDAVAVAASAGFFIECYDREIVLSLPKLWQGAPAMGGQNYRTSWISGGAHRSGALWAHEVGHTYGWRHANYWQVPAGSPPILPSGQSIEYGDKFDTMGDFRNFHHFNPWFKLRASWLSATDVLDVSASGLYTIAPYERTPASDALPSALRIRMAPERDYYVFYRSSEPLGNAGPVITWGHKANFRPSLLLDMTPGSLENDWQDAELAVGQTFRDDSLGLDVTTVSIGNDNTVQIQIDFDAGTAAPMDDLPVLGVAQPPRGMTVEGPVTYQVTAYDPDVGKYDGAGIQRVELAVLPNDDDQSEPIVEVTDTTAPYTLFFDPATIPDFADNAYIMSAVAFANDGGTNGVHLAHLIDLTGPDPSIVPPDEFEGRPAEVSGVALAKSAAATTISWIPTIFSDEYDVSRGLASHLNGVDYGACQNANDPDLSDTQFVEVNDALPGESYFYLIRGRNLYCPAAGTYGQLSSAEIRINLNPNACP